MSEETAADVFVPGCQECRDNRHDCCEAHIPMPWPARCETAFECMQARQYAKDRPPCSCHDRGHQTTRKIPSHMGWADAVQWGLVTQQEADDISAGKIAP
jgi:hypothetical protein